MEGGTWTGSLPWCSKHWNASNLVGLPGDEGEHLHHGSTTTLTTQPPVSTPPLAEETFHPLFRALVVIALLFVFLVGVNALGDGFKSLGQNVLDSFFAATENPFTALMVGILATTLVQSSSVTTSLIVALVAAPEHALPIANAIPMIMGANIGTTVTNTIVSMAHMGRPDEFRRAFAVATVHDFFNFIAVAVLLPLEMMTGFLRKSATFLASGLTGFSGVQYESPIKGALKATVRPIKTGLAWLFEAEQAQALALILIAAALIFVALFLLVRVMRSLMQSRVESYVSVALKRSALLGILLGVMVTVMVQSSSITTALLVPLGGAGLITVSQAFPITLGANIGTTVTALLAALAATGVNAGAGLTIAIVHLLFNVTGTIMIYPIPAIRKIPIEGARWLAATATRSRKWAVIYVLAIFYGVPALFALLNQFLK
ncbi:MAG: Na/Pi symporter [Gemmatimonadota bacterium]|nr:MAG: Na/Pi symporter [Gemmatimonadota bacterium]